MFMMRESLSILLLLSIIIMETTIGIGTAGRTPGALSHKLFAA
jgi:hypothetical protein